MMKIEGNRTACDDTGYQCLPAPVSGLLGGDLSALVVTVLFLFSVLSIPKFNLSEVVVFAAFPLFLMGAARVSSGAIAKRLLQLSPFVLFMAAGNILLDRTPAMAISGITLSGGMISGTVVVVKTIISVSALLSVTHSIPFYRICRALEALHLPDVLITQLMLLDRYRLVLEEEALAMKRARDIRSFGGRGKELFRTATLIGSLLLRTTSRAERLYRSMSARGFQGRMSTRNVEKISLGEWKTIVLWALIFLVLRLIF